jgi:hypothetical protein
MIDSELKLQFTMENLIENSYHIEILKKFPCIYACMHMIHVSFVFSMYRMFVLILLAFFFVGMSLNIFSQLLSSHTRETVQLKRRIEDNSLVPTLSGLQE